MKKILKKIIVMVLSIAVMLGCIDGTHMVFAKTKSVYRAYKTTLSKLQKKHNNAFIEHKYIRLAGEKQPVMLTTLRVTSDGTGFVAYRYTKSGKVKQLCLHWYGPLGVYRYKNYIMVSYGHYDLDYGVILYKYSKGNLKIIKKYIKRDNPEHTVGSEDMEGKLLKTVHLKKKNFKLIL